MFNILVLDPRDRVHDLAVYKALGMTPRQTIAMVVASVTSVGPLGGLVIALLGALLPAGWAARTRTLAALRTE